jgi:hypothetical protein
MQQHSADSFASSLFSYSERDLAIDELHAATAIYTKSNVIDPLLDRIGWPNSDLSLLDPACGDGSFLLRALRAVNLRANDVDALEQIRGWEIHPYAAAEARVNVATHLVQTGWDRRMAQLAAERMIVEDDFLAPSHAIGSYKIVASNPPYLRFGRLPDYFKGVYGDTIPAHAKGDLLHAFLDRCSSVIPSDGAIAFVTADRWLFNCGAASLRENLGRRWGIDYVSRLDPSTSFYRPKDRRRGSLPRIHPIEIILKSKERAQVALSREPISPDMEASDLGTGRTLQDICSVTIGPWLGPFGLFVVDQTTAKLLPADYIIPCVDTDDLDYASGTIKRPTKFAIATDPEARPAEAIATHLLANMGRMPKRGIRNDGRFWIPPEKIPGGLEQTRLIIPRIARALKTVVVPPGVLPINHNLSVCALNGCDLATVREAISQIKDNLADPSIICHA